MCSRQATFHSNNQNSDFHHQSICELGLSLSAITCDTCYNLVYLTGPSRYQWSWLWSSVQHTQNFKITALWVIWRILGVSNSISKGKLKVLCSDVRFVFQAMSSQHKGIKIILSFYYNMPLLGNLPLVYCMMYVSHYALNNKQGSVLTKWCYLLLYCSLY